MEISSQRATFIERCLGELATSLAFHPVELAIPELAPFGDLAEHVLLREHPDGYWQMIMLMACERADELGERAEAVVEFGREHPALTADIHLRISCVGIGLGGLSRTRRKQLLRPVRLHDNHLVVRRFWLSLDRRHLFAFYSPWSLAPGFEINPCDPDENLFVRLVRHDRYLKPTSTPVVTEYVHRQALIKERAFLSGLSGRRVLVRTILILNILIWLTLEFSGGSTEPIQLVRAGAKAGGLIRAGQYWRLVTPIFLHFGLLHLALNAAGLLFLGEVLERIYGSMQFALLYFVSGIVSVLTSFLFGPELMVGASGAIFGLAGALVVYGYRYRSRIPKRHGAMFGGALLPLIGFNILLGVFIKGIDNSAHLGGLAAGVVVALCLRPLADEIMRPSWTSMRRIAALGVLGLVAGSLVVAGVSFVRFSSIYETDSRWLLTEEIPGGPKLRVPGSWVATTRTQTEAAFESVCYDARLEARALDMSGDATHTFLAELTRIMRRGFQLPGDASLMSPAVMGTLFQRGRVQVLMPGRARRRQQVFILSDDTLISVGVEIAEKDAAQFAPVEDRILATLPEPR